MRAIDEARQRRARLLFLHVVDDGWAADEDDQTRSAIADELEWIGQALLQIAWQRARDSGLSAEMMLRTGDTWEEIAQAAREVGAVLVMVGVPSRTPTAGGQLAARLAEDLDHASAIEVVDEGGVTVAARR